MGKKLISIDVRGKNHTWGFAFYGDPKNIAEWQADGLEVYEIENVIPEWVAGLGVFGIRIWCLLQDLWNLRNPFRN